MFASLKRGLFVLALLHPSKRPRSRQAVKEKYQFWETQPVAQFNENDRGSGDGPIDKTKTVEEIRGEPYPLPDGFEWSTCDISDSKVVEEVYELLADNYVEDDDAMFRFSYPTAFLQWALEVRRFRRRTPSCLHLTPGSPSAAGPGRQG